MDFFRKCHEGLPARQLQKGWGTCKSAQVVDCSGTTERGNADHRAATWLLATYVFAFWSFPSPR